MTQARRSPMTEELIPLATHYHILTARVLLDHLMDLPPLTTERLWQVIQSFLALGMTFLAEAPPMHILHILRRRVQLVALRKFLYHRLPNY